MLDQEKGTVVNLSCPSLHGGHVKLDLQSSQRCSMFDVFLDPRHILDVIIAKFLKRLYKNDI